MQQSSQSVYSTNLEDNSGLFQKVFGQGSPHNNSAVKWNDRKHYTLKPFKLGGANQDITLQNDMCSIALVRLTGECGCGGTCQSGLSCCSGWSWHFQNSPRWEILPLAERAGREVNQRRRRKSSITKKAGSDKSNVATLSIKKKKTL